jgi:hypothetical protein
MGLKVSEGKTKYMIVTVKNRQTKAELYVTTKNYKFQTVHGFEGHAVVQLVEALRYKPEGRGLDSQWCHWNFSYGRTLALELTQPLTKISTRNISWG